MIPIITFRLPVDSDADFTYANVTHEGTFLQQSEVKTDANGNKYVEVSSNTEYYAKRRPARTHVQCRPFLF